MHTNTDLNKHYYTQLLKMNAISNNLSQDLPNPKMKSTQEICNTVEGLTEDHPDETPPLRHDHMF